MLGALKLTFHQLHGKSTPDSERNQSQCHFFPQQISHAKPGLNPILRGERPTTNSTDNTVRLHSKTDKLMLYGEIIDFII